MNGRDRRLVDAKVALRARGRGDAVDPLTGNESDTRPRPRAGRRRGTTEHGDPSEVLDVRLYLTSRLLRTHHRRRSSRRRCSDELLDRRCSTEPLSNRRPASSSPCVVVVVIARHGADEHAPASRDAPALATAISSDDEESPSPMKTKMTITVPGASLRLDGRSSRSDAGGGATPPTPCDAKSSRTSRAATAQPARYASS